MLTDTEPLFIRATRKLRGEAVEEAMAWIDRLKARIVELEEQLQESIMREENDA